ncbi:MAG: envelope stress response membrane protein PspC [Deltaproteobacteria bacterium]|jgi:phage shock protein C|nr:MAG: envelope stress response membrane protein PspC [Deltaproteobacteria bacterium]
MRRFEKILRDGLYRSRNGLLLGVCRGIAEYFHFSVFWTRAIVLILLFFSGFWPIMALYFIAALLMKPEPIIPIESDDQQEFYNSYIYSRKGAIDRLKRRYENLERRIQLMEHTVTTKEFDWDRRLNT